MTTLPAPVPADQEARRLALTERQHGLLVEAGAGSGKTAILAGRVALLIADGVAPRSIAAITFTELAAAELAGRATHYVQELVEGRVPATIAAAFPAGTPSEEQRQRLEVALGTLDELTCTTIHGFASELLRPYPVEADIDPGATVLDGEGQEEKLSRVHEEWQREVLNGTDASNEPLARVLTAPKAPRAEALLKMLALVREHSPAGMDEPPAPDGRAAATTLATCCDLLGSSPAGAEAVSDLLPGWQRLIRQLRQAPLDAVLLLTGERDPDVWTKAGQLRALRKKSAWVTAATTDSFPKKEAENM